MSFQTLQFFYEYRICKETNTLFSDLFFRYPLQTNTIEDIKVRFSALKSALFQYA